MASHTTTNGRGLGIITSAAAATAPSAKVLFEPEALPSVKVDAAISNSAWEGDLLIIAVTEEDFKTEAEATSIVSDRLKALDTASGGVITDIIAAGGFDGKQGQQSKVLRVGSAPGLKAKQVALVGLGKAAKATTVPDWGISTWQALGNAVAVLAKGARAVSAGVLLSDVPPSGAEELTTAVSQIATGALLGGWEGTRFKSKASPTASKLSHVQLIGDVLSTGGQGLDQALVKAEAVARGTLVTRYLVEAPPNICTPTHLAECAVHIAQLAPSTMQATILEKPECEAMNMGLYLGVAEASDHPPKFIHLKYTSPGDGPKKKIALVGKGLTFDSGGYNLKAGPGSMIEMMKFDMGGAGSVLGAARIIAGLSPPGLEIHFIVAACENMVAGKGLRPGDVLTSASGKTVEVNNTDAEGRLTLADALWYAQEKCGATSIIDTATLTGAVIVALGTEIAGLFTPSDNIASSITTAAKVSGEKVWRMPFENNYFEQFKSACADMKNTGSRWGGAIAAATFLKQYVNEGVEWAHLDIAGPVWDEKANLPTGYGASLLAHWAISQAETKA